MRVLWFCSSPALGAELVGAPPPLVGGWTATLEAALQRQGEVELSVAFPWRVDGLRKLEGGGHTYLPFPGHPRGHRLRRLLAAATCRLEPAADVRYLHQAVEATRPDLIHVWGTEAFYGLVAERCELPLLIEIQGLRTQCAAAYCSELTRLDLLRFGSPKRLLNGRSLLHRYYRYRKTARREQRILSRARFVCGRTQWDRLASTALAPRARYFHCDRALRTPFYGAEWRPHPSADTLRVVSTLRGNAYKGVETLVRCAALLRRLSSRRVVWRIVGVRPGEEVARIVERKLGTTFEGEGIELLGRQPAEAVVEQLLGGDLFVHPSRIDNSPNGLCEAMLLGLPVISTNVGGIPSLLEGGEEGLLVPAGDPWVLAGAIRSLAADPEAAARLGAAARRRALRRHDRATVAGRMVEIYREILAGQPGAVGLTIG